MRDDMIVDLYLRRDEAAIIETSKKYGNYCFAIANNILKDKTDSEECMNDAFLTAWNTIPPQIPNFLKAFLGKITRNLSLDRYKYNNAKKRKADEMGLLLDELSDCLPSAEVTMDQHNFNHTTQIINNWLRNQPSDNRIVFIKRYWYSQSISSVATDMSMSESKVKSMLFRMRQQLKKKLIQEGIEV